MILSQIRHFCLVCGSIFIAMDLKNGKYCKNKQEKVNMEKALKKREAQAVVIEEMRRTGKNLPRIGKTKSPLTH